MMMMSGVGVGVGDAAALSRIYGNNERFTRDGDSLVVYHTQ